MDRRVWLESTTNTRDLGGLATADGRWVRRGLLFRTDALLAPTDVDRELLAGLGLRHAIDFRSVAEVEALGGNQLDGGVRLRLMPLVDEGTAALGEAMVRALREQNVELAVEALGGGRAQELGVLGPTSLVRSTVARKTFADVIHLIAGADGVPLLFNCTAGKDRTGVFAALILRMLDVEADVIIEDYLLSNECRADYNAAAYQRLAQAGLDIELVRPLLEQRPEAMVAMFDAIDEDFGDFETYLRGGLGLAPEVLSAVRTKLLEE